jgi:hypothetical protein
MRKRLTNSLLLVVPVALVIGLMLYLEHGGGLFEEEQSVAVREGGSHWLEVTVTGSTQPVNIAFIRQVTGKRTGEGSTVQSHPAHCPVAPGERYTIFAYGTEGAASLEVFAREGTEAVQLALKRERPVNLYVTDEHEHKLANLKLEVREAAGYSLDVTTNKLGRATFYLPDEATAISIYPWGGDSDAAFREFTTASQLAAMSTYVPIGDGNIHFRLALK